MNDKFDELAKGLAQSVTRRQVFIRLGVGLAGMALACFGLANKAEAGNGRCYDKCFDSCCDNYVAGGGSKANCGLACGVNCSISCYGILD
jgi:hypothetical protein